MTLSRDEKAELARYRLQKADGLLADGETLLKAASFASSANRSYYAALSAARALLATRGSEPGTDEGVKVLLSKDFVRTGLLEREASELLRILQARRMDSDYGDYIEIGAEEASDSLARSRRFVEMCRTTLEKVLGADH